MLTYHFGAQAPSLAIPMCDECYGTALDTDYLRTHRLTPVASTLVPWRDWREPDRSKTRVLTYDSR